METLMGLDIVEVVMRCEESFDVRLEPTRLGQMRTVGDLFELICEELKLPREPATAAPKDVATLPPVVIPDEGWCRNSVWIKVVQICVDQLQVESAEVKYAASFVDDLGAD
jgi:acyl carrier protein